MSDNPSASRNRDSLLENFAAEVTSAAYAVALRHGVEDKWLDLQLELWEALKETVKKWKQEPPHFSDVPFLRRASCPRLTVEDALSGTTMMNAIILQMLQVSSRQVEQAVGGFTEAHWRHVPAGDLNCASWIVGHAVLIDRQVLEELDVPSLPAIPDEWPSLYEVRPGDGLATEYYSGQFILAQFVTNRNALIRAVSEAAADSLNRELERPGEQRYNPLRGDEDNPLFGYRTLMEMVANMSLYTSQLAGELCVLRQSFRLPIDNDWLL
jgi:hypothetical protein